MNQLVIRIYGPVEHRAPAVDATERALIKLGWKFDKLKPWQQDEQQAEFSELTMKQP